MEIENIPYVGDSADANQSRNAGYFGWELTPKRSGMEGNVVEKGAKTWNGQRL
jgi:hypothetical protein